MSIDFPPAPPTLATIYRFKPRKPNIVEDMRMLRQAEAKAPGGGEILRTMRTQLRREARELHVQQRHPRTLTASPVDQIGHRTLSPLVE